MTDAEYIKIYAGNQIIVQAIKLRLEDAGINPVIKDETESGRLAGFGATIIGQQDVYVHESEIEKAVAIVDAIKSKMEEN